MERVVEETSYTYSNLVGEGEGDRQSITGTSQEVESQGKVRTTVVTPGETWVHRITVNKSSEQGNVSFKVRLGRR